MDDKSVQLTITGRVQGVFFRAWTEENARALGLSGYVRNLRDGSVEAVFVGQGQAVEEMIARCRQGPPRARVDDIARAPGPDEVPEGFSVKRTV